MMRFYNPRWLEPLLLNHQLLPSKEKSYEQIADQERCLRLTISRGDGLWKQYPDTDLLVRSEVALVDKLTQLESLWITRKMGNE